MKFLALVALVALLGYASADCGCLRCAKHLTVIGKTVPFGNCPPTTVICRGPPNAYAGQSLPAKIQVPVPVAATPAAADELTFRIVATGPCGARQQVVEPVGFTYDTKVEVPVPVPTTSTTTTNLKPCIDRIVIPSPPGGCGAGTGEQLRCGEIIRRGYGGQFLVNQVNEPTVYVNPIRDTPVYVNPIRPPPVYVNPIRDPVDAIRPCGTPLLTETSVPVYKTEEIRQSSGPALDFSLIKTVYSRYKNSNGHVSGPVGQVDNNNLACMKGYSMLKSRLKREVPFVKHGYKFVMNMLPQFIQQPIKNTVNGLAFTHPDKRLQRIYSEPRKLSLKEKLQMQSKQKLAMLKSKLKNRNVRKNLIQKSYTHDDTVDREATKFLSSLYEPSKYSQYQWQHQFPSRSNFVDQNRRSSQYLGNEYLQSYFDSLKQKDESDRSFARDFKGERSTDFLEDKNAARKAKMTELEKAMLLRKLRTLNEDQNRSKRSPIYEKYWPHRHKTSSSIKKPSTLFDSSELVLPFYHIKEESSEEDQSSNYNYQYDNPWDEYLSKSFATEKQRYRRENDVHNFLAPYTFQDVVTENYRTDQLRNVIRDELERHKIQNEEPQGFLEPIANNNKIPQSPILNIVTFPVRLMKKFNDVTKQTFPEMESVPKMIKGTKRYFRDFGRNFRKNVLHLTSDLIGDFEHLDLTNGLTNIIVPPRQRRNVNHKDIEDTGNDLDGLGLNGLIRKQYEPEYSLVFSNENEHADEEKQRRKRYILKMMDEGEVEKFLMDKLGEVFDSAETSTTTERYPTYPTHPNYWPKQSIPNSEEESKKKLVLQPIKPRIILDNNGRPFLEINGYKRPVLKKRNRSKKRHLRPKNSFRNLRYYHSSEEVDSEKISSLIDHAKDHLESNLNSKYSEMPIKTIKEKISQLLYETDVLVHMDFGRYDNIYDDLIALQHMKISVVQDWKRLIISKAINDVAAKIELLEKFKELQYYKDLTLTNVVSSLYEDNENVFIAKKLIKMLVRLQKLQCIINQVVENFHNHLHISSQPDIAKEIKYVDYLSSLNFSNEKSRNKVITNLIKDRDAALQNNIFLLDKLRNLLMYERDGDKVEQEANLLWEMKNINNMQRASVEEMKQMIDHGYNIKKELKILFDLLRRYETCEANQRKLLSKCNQESSEEKEEEEEDESSEDTEQDKVKKMILKRKLDLNELKSRWQERLKKRKMLLMKKIRRNSRKKSEESVEYE